MDLKVALITGGSSGIGAATALALAKAGIKVYAVSRRGTTPVEHPLVVPIQLDINDEAGTEKVVADIVKADGRLDAVVCNAGAGIYGPVENTTDAEVREQFETTYFGSLKTIRACLPVFRKQGFGRIITITSVMAVLQLPYQAFYSSAKAAILSVSQSLSMELKGTGIECCSILPGDVATGFTSARKMIAKADDPAYAEGMKKNLAKIEKDENGGMSPDVIAKAVLRQLKRRHMAVRVIPRADYKAVGLLVRILPAKWVLTILKWLY